MIVCLDGTHSMNTLELWIELAMILQDRWGMQENQLILTLSVQHLLLKVLKRLRCQIIKDFYQLERAHSLLLDKSSSDLHVSSPETYSFSFAFHLA